MSATSQTVPVDVLPPLPAGADGARPVTVPAPASSSGIGTFLHPASGVAILGIDLLCFGPEVFLPFTLPVMCALAFFATFAFVYFIQTKWTRDNSSSALGKAFLGAFLAGLPFSIAGTIFGAAVIAASGLPRHPGDVIKKITGFWKPLSR